MDKLVNVLDDDDADIGEHTMLANIPSLMTITSSSIADSSGSGTLQLTADPPAPRRPSLFAEALLLAPFAQLDGSAPHTPSPSAPVLLHRKPHAEEIPDRAPSFYLDEQETIRDFFAAAGAGQSAANVLLQSARHAQQLSSDVISPGARLRWEIWFWTKNLVLNILSVFLYCVGALSIMTIFLKSVIPIELWYLRAAVECLISGITATWPPQLARFVLHPQFTSRLTRGHEIAQVVLCVTYTATVNVYEGAAGVPAPIGVLRIGILACYIINMTTCAYICRDRRPVELVTSTAGTGGLYFLPPAPRIPLYIIITHVLPLLLIPLYLFAIIPLMEHAARSQAMSQEAGVVVIVAMRFVVHPLITEVVITLSRTVTVMSIGTVSPHVMFAMLSLPQVVTVFGSRLLIAGVASDLGAVYILTVSAIVEIIFYATIRERHILIRKIQKGIGRCLRCCFPGGARNTCFPRQRPMERAHGSRSTTPHTGLQRDASGWDLDILPAQSDESTRFEKLLVDSTYTHILFEYIALLLIPFVYIVYYDASPGSTIAQEDLWHAMRFVALQCAFEVATDVCGITILYLRGVNVLATRDRHSVFSFGMESIHFIYYFVLILVAVPSHDFLRTYAPFRITNHLPLYNK